MTVFIGEISSKLFRSIFFIQICTNPKIECVYEIRQKIIEKQREIERQKRDESKGERNEKIEK